MFPMHLLGCQRIENTANTAQMGHTDKAHEITTAVHHPSATTPVEREDMIATTMTDAAGEEVGVEGDLHLHVGARPPVDRVSTSIPMKRNGPGSKRGAGVATNESPFSI